MEPLTQSQLKTIPLAKIKWWFLNGLVPLLCAGGTASDAFWQLEVQGLLMSEVGILICHQKLDKHPTHDAMAWEQYQKCVLAVSVPPERVRRNLLVSCRKLKDWTGPKAWAKQCKIIKIICKEPNNMWLTLFLANELPSSETLAGAMGRWWKAMWLLEDKKQTECHHGNLLSWVKQLSDLLD